MELHTMNAGTNKDKALTHAMASARADGKPRYLHCYNGCWWIKRQPPEPGPMAGMYASGYLVVWPMGTYQAYDPTKGSPTEPTTEAKSVAPDTQADFA